MIDCRRFDDPDSGKSLRTHVGRNPRIMKSVMESEEHHELHRRLYDDMSRFLSSENIVIMIYKSGRHCSVANPELSRYGRHQHSVSLLHLSELDFWKNTCVGKCSERNKQSTRILQTHHDRVRAECSRLASATDALTEDWKRPRPESHSQGCAGNKNQNPRFAENSLDEENHFERASKRPATNFIMTPVEPNTASGILGELAERLGHCHESARALVDYLQTRNVRHKTDQCMIETAKCMFHKLLGVQISVLRPHGIHVVLVPRQRARNLILVPRRWLRNLVFAPRQ